jgi:hypothetical protein
MPVYAKKARYERALERRLRVGRDLDRPLSGITADRLLMAGRRRPATGFDGQVSALQQISRG